MNIPRANRSLTARGWELGHAPRWVIYLAKCAQGAGVALALASAFYLYAHTWPPLALVAVLCVPTTLLMFVVSYVTGDYAFNPLDWVCDFALALMWYVPVAIRADRPLLALAIIAAWGITYPWSTE